MRKIVGLAAFLGLLGIGQQYFTEAEWSTEVIPFRQNFLNLSPLAIEGNLPQLPGDMAPFSELELGLQIKSLSRDDEVAWVSDGDELKNATRSSLYYGVNLDAEVVSSILRKPLSDTVFFYHNHPPIELTHGDFLTGIHPPSATDFTYLAQASVGAERFSKQMISRVVDSYGVWEYNIEDKMCVSRDLDGQLLTVLREKENDFIEEQVKAVIPIYEKFGLTVSYRPFPTGGTNACLP